MMDAKVATLPMSLVTKAAGLLVLLGFAANGSTCKETSNGGATKDPSEVADVNLTEVDSSMLTPREKKDWSGAVSDLLAPCPDVPVSIAQCVQEKRACKKCVPAAKFLVRQVRDGRSRKQIDEAFHNRFDPSKVKNVELGNAPTKGPSDAPITIVEFADFECPVCGATYPMLEKVIDLKKDKVRFAYKFLALPMHKNAEPAARAGIAAIAQGKFWEMHHKLFENQTRLSGPELEGYAREVGLDVAKFKADKDGKEATDRLEADKKQADVLGVKGTPTIYVNGREYDRSQDLLDWINMELDFLDIKSSPAPSASSGAAAEAGAPADAAKPSPADAGKK